MCVEIAWYGERGIINSLVLALKNAGVEAVRELLRAVQWANDHDSPNAPDWINSVTGVKFLVEIGASQFGDPDLIIICRTDELHPWVVFLEAKVASYIDSAMSIRRGIRKNFNSSINGQISLKYRLSRSLYAWAETAHCLSEPPDLAESYQRAPDEGGLGDPSRFPRKLAKPGVLQILRESGLAGTPPERFRYVALTCDHRAFFESENFEAWEFRPLFLNHDGTENWAAIRAQVGWLGYDVISERANLARYLGEQYTRAVATMISPIRARVAAEGRPQAGIPIKTYRIEEKSSEQIKMTLGAIEVIAKARFGQTRVKREHGSTSVRPFDRVLAKLVPQEPGRNEHLLLAIAASMGLQNNDNSPLTEYGLIGAGRNAQSFCMTRLPQETERAVDIADGLFEMLAERLELDQNGRGI